MMNPTEFRYVAPHLLPALEAALDSRAAAKARLADFKKKYSAVKAKVKRLEKEMASMDPEKHRYEILVIVDNVRLAVNKFVLIDKKLKQFQQGPERNFRTTLRALQSGEVLDPNMAVWYIRSVEHSVYATNDLLSVVLDMLRIAKGHLKKVDDHKKYLRRLFGPNYRQLGQW
jgi:hypothetical protein